MKVSIVKFKETKVAAVEHHGPPEREYESSIKLIEWRKANRVSPENHQTFGIHYTNPVTTLPQEHRVDFCVSFEGSIEPNPQGVIEKIIPSCRCAVARQYGSREHNSAAVYLYEQWLPYSGESLGNFPIFFHYVNVGPNYREEEMITDVYLPLSATGEESI